MWKESIITKGKLKEIYINDESLIIHYYFGHTTPSFSPFIQLIIECF